MKKMHYAGIISFAFSASLSLASIATAQIKIHVATVYEENYKHACGVTKEVLEATAIQTLRRNNFSISNAMTNPFLYLNVVVRQTSTACAASIRIELLAMEEIKTYGAFRDRSEYQTVQLCSSGALLSGVAQVFSKPLSDSIESHINKCLADVDYQ